MHKFKGTKIFKEKGVVIALALCLVSAAAIGGSYAVRQNQKAENMVDLNELPDTKTASENTSDVEQAATDKVVNEEAKKAEEEQKAKEAAKQAEEEKAKQEAKETAAKAKKTAATFQDSEKLAWPVQGNVIMDYSMDKTIYFSTLDQYKYNPAIVIGSEVNTKVTAAFDGTVQSITVNEETGNTVTVDMGNGYTAVYGQLKEVPLSEGEVIQKGSVIGYVSEPTKYYNVEGCNLYFAVQKDGKPVDPMNYLQ